MTPSPKRIDLTHIGRLEIHERAIFKETRVLPEAHIVEELPEIPQQIPDWIAPQIKMPWWAIIRVFKI